jgi:hypothetical protein
MGFIKPRVVFIRKTTYQLKSVPRTLQGEYSCSVAVLLMLDITMFNAKQSAGMETDAIYAERSTKMET